ncbi:protein transport protein Sec24C-like [Eurosta solidaginis]|uniref:protein transport protein Sec24C-like n=1 Tax=Eurosta solidaginis TaxID=178769 RepID=UPI0035316913
MARTVEGEYEPPIVNFDAGRRYHCLMCKVTTDVPTVYLQHLGHTGRRVDKYERPELVLGTYEFLCKKCVGTDRHCKQGIHFVCRG